MLEQTDCCSVLAHVSSLTSSLFSKTETVLKPLWLLPTAVPETGAQGSLQCSDFCSTLPCLPLRCVVMSAAFLATDLSVDMQSFTCLCAFMKRQHRNQHWHMRLFLALGKSCLHLFTYVFHYAAKVVLARLRQVWSGLPEDPWCKTRRSKALEKNVFAVFFTGVRKAFVKMPLC